MFDVVRIVNFGDTPERERRAYRAQYGGGSLRAAIEWFCNATVAEFENRTVKELIASGEIDPVLMYLSSSRAGSSG
jgi:hypothetical protein